MILPSELNDKISLLANELKNKDLKQTRIALTNRYKNETGQSTNLVLSKNDSILYAISRMPATYSVIYSLVSNLIKEGYFEKINKVCDIGSGTGSAYFVLNEIFDEIDLSLFERNQNMIDIFNFLTDNKKLVNKCDVTKIDFSEKFDLVMTSFVLSEMTPNDRNMVFEKMLNISEKYVLVIDTGTPETYKNIYNLKNIALIKGYRVVAPCMCENCSLKSEDYCQFYARVERSSLLRQSKSASLPYEDEKFFYMLFEKLGDDFNELNETIINGTIIKKEKLNQKSLENFSVEIGRVIRRPKIKEKEVELVLCSKGGVITKSFTKSNKLLFKKAKKIKINQILFDENAIKDDIEAD